MIYSLMSEEWFKPSPISIQSFSQPTRYAWLVWHLNSLRLVDKVTSFPWSLQKRYRIPRIKRHFMRFGSLWTAKHSDLKQSFHSCMHGTHGKIGQCYLVANASWDLVNNWWDACPSNWHRRIICLSVIWVFLRSSFLDVTVCAVAVECSCLIFV